jgi:hypothetical protein
MNDSYFGTLSLTSRQAIPIDVMMKYTDYTLCEYGDRLGLVSLRRAKRTLIRAHGRY